MLLKKRNVRKHTERYHRHGYDLETGPNMFEPHEL
jgi:hypothetical protein